MKVSPLLLFLMIFCACDDPFQYSPNEVVLKDEALDLNRKNIDRLQKDHFTDTLKFIFISDTHHSYEELTDFTDTVNKMEGISFVLVDGDITNFGLQWEYEEYRKRMSNLYAPYITVIGNHDLLGNGEEVYEKMFDKMNFSFRCNGNTFICLNSNSREYNFNGSIPDLHWLNAELANTGQADHIFVMCHVAPFDPDFDPELESLYASTLNAYSVDMSMHGHKGSFMHSNYYNNEVGYAITEDLSSRTYILVKMWSDSYSLEQKSY